MTRLVFVSGCVAIISLGLGFSAIAQSAADGEELYKKHCGGCHGLAGEKKAIDSKPLNQSSGDALAAMIKGYAEGSYGGKNKGIMLKVLGRISPEELAAVVDHMKAHIALR